MKYITTRPRLFNSEDTPPWLFDDIHASFSIKTPASIIDYTTSHTCLFEGCAAISSPIRWTHIKVKHDDTWTSFGRSFYESRDYTFTGFHCTLCSVDELKRKVAEMMRQYERNRVYSDWFALSPILSDALERYLSQRHWNEPLLGWIEDFCVDTVIERELWTADDHHSCHPYKDLLLYQHQLAKLCLSVQRAQTAAASRPCCRSFLMASRHQKSGDDLLGH